MLTLVFTICLFDDPKSCEQREMIVHEPISAMACLMSAPSELARWRETHPNWRIARWKCADNRPTDRSANTTTRG